MNSGRFALQREGKTAPPVAHSRGSTLRQAPFESLRVFDRTGRLTAGRLRAGELRVFDRDDFECDRKV